MTDHVIETVALRKEFRSRRGRHVVAVDGLDLSVSPGGVHGFLGPNGSGKTTTIRMLLGLARATSGRMRLFGQEVPEALPRVIGRIGAVVEQPKFTPSFSGRRNLVLLADSVGLPRAAVDRAIEQVGLAGRAQERYRGYSLGMKQRLAIAATLMKSPELLILDEPTNGLDPAGIRSIRTLIAELGGSGVTVLLSSHILAEVQQVCDSVSIIGNGRLLAHGRVDDLIGADGRHGYRVGVSDPDTAAGHLSGAGFGVRRDGDHLVVEGPVDPAAITKALAAQGLFLHELTADRPDLESVFLDLTQHDVLGGGR